MEAEEKPKPKTFEIFNKHKPKVKVLREFMDFLKEYKVIALAIAFVMGVASTALIKSLVDNIIMPLIGPLIPGGNWQTAVLTIWKFKIGWGAFVGELLNFVIIAFVIFLIAKFIMREEKVTKK
jgi:large conductance mechanosensitive channel